MYVFVRDWVVAWGLLWLAFIAQVSMASDIKQLDNWRGSRPWLNPRRRPVNC